jgi:hypothetical protein
MARNFSEEWLLVLQMTRLPWRRVVPLVLMGSLGVCGFNGNVIRPEVFYKLGVSHQTVES